MKKLVTFLSIVLASTFIMTNVAVLAEERELNADELAAFITREEFNEWQEAFIASLSELDKVSTEKIYSDMDFYDMQYRFTVKYKQKQYWDEDLQEPTALLKEMILKGKAQRNRL